MNRPTRRDQLIAATAFVFVPTAAHAYIDPGSAGFIITRFPAWAPDRRPDRFTLLLAAAAALGAGLVFLRLASYGPRMWWDPVNYITTARKLLAGDGVVVSQFEIPTR